MCFTITSASMRPAFFPGDKIGIKRKRTPYRFGDIVLFRNTDGFCIHRIIGERDGRFFTKGDGKRTPDPPLNRESILGRAVWVERAGAPGISLRMIRWRERASLHGAVGRCMNVTQGVLSLIDSIVWSVIRDIFSGWRGWRKGVE